MKKNAPEKWIKAKLTAGFLIVFVIALLFFGISYVSVVRVIKNQSYNDNFPQKMVLLNRVLSQMIEAEGYGRIYGITEDPKFKELYHNKRDSIEILVNNLHQYFTDTLALNQIDTIQSLFSEKEQLMESLIQINIINKYRKQYGELISVIPDSLEYEITYTKYTSTFTDSIEKKGTPVKRKTLQKLSDFLTGKKPEPTKYKVPVIEQRVDSSKVSHIRKDSTLIQIKRELSQYQAQQARFTRALSTQEQQLVKLDNQIMNKIREVVQSLEDEAFRMSAVKSQEMESMRGKTFNQLIYLGISALIIFALFILWVNRDILRSRRLNDQLRSSKDKVDQLLKVKEQFLANMSHEIRTPLTSVIGFAELLSEGLADKPQANMAKTLLSSARHLHRMVNEILDFSRIEANMVNLSEDEIKANELMKEVFEEMKLAAQNKKIGFSFEVEEGLADFSADRMRLKQVLINLVGNAIKFTQEGYVKFSVKREDHKLAFAVTDTGIGIPEDQKEEIFEEFSQVDNSKTKQTSGTGLGLSISKRLIKLMGGAIWLESEEGSGSTFHFTIPMKEAIGNQLSDEVIAPDFLTGKKVLCIDDDPLVHQLLEALIHDMNGEKISAYTPVEALNYLKKETFDLIVSDVQMPDTDGISLARTIRKEFSSYTPVLILTANLSESRVEEISLIENVWAMPKPFTRKSLAQKFHAILNGKDIEDLERKERTQASFSLDEIKTFSGDDNELLRTVTETFILNADESIALLKMMEKENDIPGIRKTAHKLLTGFRQFAISDGVVILKQLEIADDSPSKRDIIRASIIALSQLWNDVRALISGEVLS
jgi:signal transduction histidine kinase/DNA-binding response OmpR family regulator